MKLEGGREKLSEERLLPPPSNLPSPSPKTFVCGRRSGFVLSNGPIGALPLVGRFKANTSSQNEQAFSVTCCLLHTKTHQTGVMRKSLSLFLKTKKAANRDSITSKVFGDGGVEDGRGEEGPFSRKVPSPLPQYSFNPLPDQLDACALRASVWAWVTSASTSSWISPSSTLPRLYKVRLMRWSVTRPCGKL